MENHKSPKRRTFLKQASAFGILSLVSGVGLGVSWKLSDKNHSLLRPPAAVDEFLSLCIKCGQCLQVCPYDSIELSNIKEGNGIGTPYINAYERGCYLCALLPCVLACPSGALDHNIDNIKQVDMGKAKVVNLSSCLALENKTVTKEAIKKAFFHSHTLSDEEMREFKILPSSDTSEKRELEVDVIKKLEELVDKPCSICADLCPYPNQEEAIALVKEKSGKKPVIKQECVGCGVCVELCPTNVLAILPNELPKESA